MRKVLIGMIVGLVLMATYCIVVWNAYDAVQLMGPKAMRRRKYVKVRPDNYN